jgi:hypothetical protein
MELKNDVNLKQVITHDGLIFYVDMYLNIYSKDLKLLSQKLTNDGYAYVSVKSDTGCQCNRYVHRILAQAFIKPDLDGSYEVHHKDRNPSNNSISNLQPMLRYEHKLEHLQKYPLTKFCEVCGKEFTPHKTKRLRAHVCFPECKHKLDIINAEKRKRKIVQYTKNLEFVKLWDSARDVQNTFGFAESNINKCCNDKIKSAYGYIWKYAE